MNQVCNTVMIPVEEYEALRTKVAKLEDLHQQEMNPISDCATISINRINFRQMEKQLAAMTQERDHYKEMDALHIQSLGLKIEQLTAAQARNKELREALNKAALHVRPTCSELYDELQHILATPDDSSALDAALKAERERCAKVCEDHPDNLGAGNRFAAAIRSMK